MRKIFSKLKFLIPPLCIAAACAGATMAFLGATDKPVRNEFSFADVKTEIIEDSGGSEESKAIWVQNTGESDAFVRVLLKVSAGTADVVFASSADSVPEMDMRNENTIYVVANIEKWSLNDDGYYYYKGILKKNAVSEKVIDGVFCGKNIDAEEFDIVAYAEAVLASEEYGIENAAAAFEKVS